jgi:cob(I)alamin adenosyltransferase
MSIYTKRGDRGETSTLKSRKLSKSSPLIEAIGAVDELNSFLGIIGGFEAIQSNLFAINAILAGAKLRFPKSKITNLEKEIDALEKALPRQKGFIFYGGKNEAALLFYARSICRYAERRVVFLNRESKVPDNLLAYMNRISDYLYMKGREINFKANISEKAWRQ